jgi:hypothetical protein
MMKVVMKKMAKKREKDMRMKMNMKMMKIMKMKKVKKKKEKEMKNHHHSFLARIQFNNKHGITLNLDLLQLNQNPLVVCRI